MLGAVFGGINGIRNKPGYATWFYSTESYTYDGLGRLTNVNKDWQSGLHQYWYDKASRVTQSTDLSIEGVNLLITRVTTTAYDSGGGTSDGRIATQLTTRNGVNESLAHSG